MSKRNRAVSVVFATVVGSAAALCAAAQDRVQLQRPAAAGEVLIFRDGRALAGEVTKTDTHFILSRTAGRLEVPKEQVETVVQDLEAAYRYKASRIDDRDAAAHFRLAEWCLLVNLRQHAISELERTLELDPKRARAAGMLTNLRRGPSDAPPPTAPIGSAVVRQSAPPPTNGPTAPSIEVPPQAFGRFTRQIQPLLVRSCGTIGCHDRSFRGSFALHRSLQPTAHTTGHNLRAALTLVDSKNADRSLLLTHALKQHGGASAAPFALGVNDPKYANLANWVRSIAATPSPKRGPAPTELSPDLAAALAGLADTKPASPAAPDSVATTETVRERASSTGRATASGLSSDGVPPAPVPAGAGVRAGRPHEAPGGAPRADTAAADGYQPVDPFDPEIFNRRHAPRAATASP